MLFRYINGRGLFTSEFAVQDKLNSSVRKHVSEETFEVKGIDNTAFGRWRSSQHFEEIH